MVTIYDMTSGVVRRTLASASEADITNNDVSLDQPQDTEQYNLPHHDHAEEQLALREEEHSGATQGNADKIPPELTSVNTDTFISDMEK